MLAIEIPSAGSKPTPTRSGRPLVEPGLELGERVEHRVDPLGGADHQVAPLGQGIDHVLDHALFGFRIKIDQDVLEKDTVERVFLEWKQQVMLLPGDQCLDLGLYRPALGRWLFIKDTSCAELARLSGRPGRHSYQLGRRSRPHRSSRCPESLFASRPEVVSWPAP